jgi:hypothetical protein
VDGWIDGLEGPRTACAREFTAKTEDGERNEPRNRLNTRITLKRVGYFQVSLRDRNGTHEPGYGKARGEG